MTVHQNHHGELFEPMPNIHLRSIKSIFLGKGGGWVAVCFVLLQTEKSEMFIWQKTFEVNKEMTITGTHINSKYFY